MEVMTFRSIYRFLMKNTGFGVSEYSFVIPEVGMSEGGSVWGGGGGDDLEIKQRKSLKFGVA